MCAVERSGPDRSERRLSEEEILFILRNGVRRYAKERGVSVRTLRRHLVSDGVRLGEQLDRARALLAPRLLVTPLSILDVARHLGFSSTQTFARFVKRRFGRTATELRRELARRRP